MHLIISTSGQPVRVVPLMGSTRLRVGRSSECEVQVADSTVSRIHAEITLDAFQKLHLRDLTSRFGTFVNGQKTSECPLRPGDIILLGETRLQIEDHLSETNTIQTAEQKLGNESAPSQMTGRTFGRFEATALISRSHEHVLFRGVDTVSSREVSLKVISTNFVNQASISRLTRARGLVLALNHEHLLQVFDAGVAHDLYWIASELVDAESAVEVIRRIGVAGMLDWRKSLKTTIQLAQALEFLGQHQIVHRNISPETIQFCRPSGSVKLGDIILAKSLRDEAAAAVTTSGEIVGNLPYCSPEQACGGTIDVRSDLYNLGATVYALLTGHAPCEGRNVVETLHKIGAETPRLPTETHLCIPHSFEGIVMKLLAKQPEDRFRDASHLLRDLRRAAIYLGEA